jgi:hypothetical protein
MTLALIGELAIQLQIKIDAKNAARRLRRDLLLAYSREEGDYYELSPSFCTNREPAIDAAHAACKAAVSECTTARCRLRRAVRKYMVAA